MTNDEALKFLPERIGEKYITFLVEISVCPICKSDMIKKPEHNHIFPRWNKIDFYAQAEKANLVIRSNVLVDNQHICKGCVKMGKADFLCVLCDTRRPTAEIEEAFGDPPEFLCKNCFENVTANKWHKAVDRLREEHKYDYY